MLYKVIIVDDEVLVRKGIISKFNNNNIDIEILGEARNGLEALKLISKREPDFIIADIKMPIMGGIELIRKVRENYPAVEFIIISGYAEFEFAREAILLGVTDYILKPIDDEVFITAINRVIINIENKNRHDDIFTKKQGSICKNRFYNMEQIINYVLFSQGADTINVNELWKNEELKHNLFLMAIVHIDTMEIDCYKGYENYKKNRDLIKQKTIDIIKKESSIYICENYEDNTEFLIIYSGDDKTCMYETFDKLLINLHRSITEIEKISITIGKSDFVEDIKNFALMYRQATLALNQRYKYGYGRIYFYNKINKIKNIRINQLIHSLAACLEQNDFKKIKICAKEIIEQIFSPDYLAVLSKDEIKLLYSQVMNEIVKFSTRMEVELVEFVRSEIISGEVIRRFNKNDEFIEMFIKLLTDIIEKGIPVGFDSKSIIQLIRRDLDKNYNQDLTLDIVSRKYGISAKYCSALFKKEIGMNFIEYINHIRIKESRSMLEDTEIDISNITHSIGYNNINYFYKIFKRETGITPIEYRNNKRRHLNP